MEDLYRLDDPTISCSNDIARVHNFGATVTADFLSPVDHLLQFDHQEADADAIESDMSEFIKSQISNHPRYPNLVYAYIECQKVGATPELASFLEEIGRENRSVSACSQIGADPELDEFMESYCQILYCYKEELSKPFNEATTFLSDMESQLSDLCKGALTKNLDNHHIDEAGGTSEEEFSCGGEVEASENRESPDDCRSEDIKVKLRRKYSGYLSSLRKEFMKKRKKGKLPRDARVTLLDWWNNHYRWPYPTEEDKLKLSEITGLEQKQINNWFINQRKRHWKPSDDMKLALMEGVAGHNGEPMYLDHGVGTNSNNI